MSRKKLEITEEMEKTYRLVKKEYTKDDIEDYAKSNGFDVPEEDLDSLADAFEDKYDCELSYWDNVHGVLECLGYEQKD